MPECVKRSAFNSQVFQSLLELERNFVSHHRLAHFVAEKEVCFVLSPMMRKEHSQPLVQHLRHGQISGARPRLWCVCLPRGRVKSAANADYTFFKAQVTTLECKDFTSTASGETENSPQS